MNHGERPGVEHFFERAQGRMQPEEAIKVNGAVIAAIRFTDRDGRAAVVVVGTFAERHNGVQTIHAAALENRHQHIPVGAVALRKGHARHPRGKQMCP